MGQFNYADILKDIKRFDTKQLEELSKDIRKKILETAENNGGHLASNLGIVETMVALYHVFDFPIDKLIFDVGHQCYAHKILSGRESAFSTIRTNDGLSGFPNKEESDHDLFTTGHAGTSISSGLGVCTARDKLGQDHFVISVVGDGSIVNGLNLEALSFSQEKPKKFIVILNDNGMSISKNINGLYQFISKGTTKKGYIKSKKLILKTFGNSFVTRFFASVKNFIKRVVRKHDSFEEFGFKYVGIVDGNDVGDIVKILSRIKLASQNEAILLHVKTTKGKGYKKAEEKADMYHGVGKELKNESGDFSLALGEKINELMDKDPSVVAITAGMKDGTGLFAVEKEHPESFIDVGIAEEFAITSAAGMAEGGLKPIVAMYSTFMQRAYDQLLHDVCLQNLPVVICLDRSGLVGMDGKTHQGVFDLSYLLHMPNLTIFAPSSTEEFKDILEYSLSLAKPVAIRYPKNQKENIKTLSIKEGLWERIKDGEKVTLVAVGPNMVNLAKEFAGKNEGVGVVSARTVKPLCEKTLDQIKNTVVVTLEENSEIGGFGSLVAKYYSQNGYSTKVIIKGVPDEFIKHSELKNQLKYCRLSLDALNEDLSEFLK